MFDMNLPNKYCELKISVLVLFTVICEEPYIRRKLRIHCIGYNTPKQNPSLFPCKSTSFSPELSHFLNVSHVEHHISLKRVTS